MGVLNGVLLTVTMLDVVINVTKGLLIISALLVLRAIIGTLGRTHLAQTVASILVNVPSEEEAVRIGRTLLEEGAVASANVTAPIRSLYRWQGRMEDRTEVVLVLKTTLTRADQTVRRVAELHSYQVPSILVVPASPLSHRPYREWVREEVGSKPWWKSLAWNDVLPTRPIWKM